MNGDVRTRPGGAPPTTRGLLLALSALAAGVAAATAGAAAAAAAAGAQGRGPLPEACYEMNDVVDLDERPEGPPAVLRAKEAIRRNDAPALARLLAGGLEPGALVLEAVAQAVSTGDAAALETLLAHGADPNHVGPCGQGILHAVVTMRPWRRAAPVARLLIDAGSDPGLDLPVYGTPLLRVVARWDSRVRRTVAPDNDDDLEAARALLEAGASASPPAKSCADGLVPVQMVVADGSDGSCGHTPLGLAIVQGDERMAALLRAHGARP